MAAPALTVDLNADVGEGLGAWQMGDDAALLALVSSASVACGFHAGDPSTMQRTCADAARNGVAIGAHVSYRDLVGFGRRDMDMAPAELAGDVLYQLGALGGIARSVGSEVRYVKAHGALYNRIVHDRAQAAAFVEAVHRYQGGLPVVTLAGSVVMELAREAGLPTVTECFADRAYTSAGTLVSRREPGSVLHDAGQIADRVVRMVTEHRVETIDGDEIVIDAVTICLHERRSRSGPLCSLPACRSVRSRNGVIPPWLGRRR